MRAFALGSSRRQLRLLAILFLFVPVSAQGQSLSPIQQPAVGVLVPRQDVAPERGSGFVISVDNDAAYILTAWHMFYDEESRRTFKDGIKVTFALDPLKDYSAEFYVNFSNLDLAILTVPMGKLRGSLAQLLKNLPAVAVRPGTEPLKLKEDIFLVSGKFQDWQLAPEKVTGLQDGLDRFDRFRFTGTGVHDAFSGSVVIDNSDRLIGIHLGPVPSDPSYGRAQIKDAIPILVANHIPTNTLDFSSTAAAKTSSPPVTNSKTASPPAAASHIPGEQKSNSKDGLAYVWIPPGAFQMGCSPGDKECSDDEKPAHQVTISKAFWLGQTAVTQAAYERVTGQNPSYFKGSNLPVEQVSWDEAKSYCQGIGGRLPTEAEWEYAARAGTTGAQYGPLDSVAWYLANSGGKTHPVGQKRRNAWMLHDMLGNVWQWTADGYDAGYYKKGDATDPQGPSDGKEKTLRGGSWSVSPRNVRASVRGRVVPGNRLSNVGVRCVGESFP